MKLSKYNVIKQEKSDTYIFNTLSGAFVRIETQQLNYINEYENKNLKEALLSSKILTEDENEIDLYKYYYYSSAFKNDSIMLQIAPTMNCNFSCFYCFEGENKFSSQMDNNVEDAIVLYLKRHKKKNISIVWFGGEPLLGFNNMISISQKLKAEEIDFNSNIITNGSLFNSKIIAQLNELNLTHIQISLDGINETHDKRRFFKNGYGSFEKILSNINNIMQHTSIPVYIQTTVDKSNIQAYHDVLHYFNEHYSEYIGKQLFINYNPVLNRTDFDNKGVCFNGDEEFCFLVDLISLNEKHKMLPRLPEKSLPCMYRSENCYAIDPAGYVYKCIEHLGNKRFAIGNILQKNISVTKLAKSAFEENPFDDEECINCNVFPVCGGGCPLDRIKNNKRKEKPYCSFYKSKLSDLLPHLYNLQKKK
jgi:uncharacterized protein